MKKFKIIGLACVLFSMLLFDLFVLAHPQLAWASLLVNQNNNPGTPLIVIEPVVVDAGIVKTGDSVQAEFMVINKGTADLVIKRVAPT